MLVHLRIATERSGEQCCRVAARAIHLQVTPIDHCVPLDSAADPVRSAKLRIAVRFVPRLASVRAWGRIHRTPDQDVFACVGEQRIYGIAQRSEDESSAGM